MSSLIERLRGVVRPAGTEVPALRTVGGHEHAADVLGGEWREDSGQRFLVVERKYGPGYRHGHVAVCEASPGDGSWERLHLLAGPHASQALDRMLFVDLETTGLAGGAGTYAFLVGCGWFDGPTFRVRQFFLSAFGAERVLLDAVTELAGSAGTVVTYNGKSFDLPLIETRYLLHRMTTPFAGMPHVDMLHSARRLWRDEQEGCRLMELEAALFGHEREGDVPGFEIPARYFNFVRSGDARPLEPVLEHNRLDLLSLALVTAKAAQMLDEGPVAARTAREAFGMGRLFERGQFVGEASACYWRGAELPGDVVTHGENLRAYAVLARRQRRFADAADAWRRVLALHRCPPHIAREATEALAVHHEHRIRDLETARQFALQALPLQGSAARREALQHRLARLNRKLAAEPTEALF